MRQTYYIEIVDKRVDLDPPYIWQSKPFKTKEEALKQGKKIAESFRRSNLSDLQKEDLRYYQNPRWKMSAKGIKNNLDTYLMVKNWYNEEEYEVEQLEQIKL